MPHSHFEINKEIQISTTPNKEEEENTIVPVSAILLSDGEVVRVVVLPRSVHIDVHFRRMSNRGDPELQQRVGIVGEA